MIVENVRLGFATNSSSTHSIIFNLNAQSDDWKTSEFGWEEFCCNNVPSKRAYLAQTIYENLRVTLGRKIAFVIVRELLTVEPVPEGYIDHQSLMSLPDDPSIAQPDIDFIREFSEYCLNSTFAFVGGNDNEEHRRFTSGRENLPLPVELPIGSLVCRKDPNTGHWTLFNRYNGAKIRLHFQKPNSPYTKAYAPELCDVCVTNKCPYGCQFCYQDSTKDGDHAKLDDLKSIAYELRRMKVFEVALGGGEPTQHPQFPYILRTFKRYNIVPNFTTFTLKWIHNPKILNAVINCSGRFALSVTDHDKVIQAINVIQNIIESISPRRWQYFFPMSFQCVMGAQSLDELKKILEASRYHPVVLLGFKQVGRGNDYKPQDYKDWISVVRSVKRTGQIGIDTALAQEFRQEILELVDEKLITFEEGKFSMYIDAVHHRCAPSSYCPEEQYVSLLTENQRPHYYKLADIFQMF